MLKIIRYFLFLLCLMPKVVTADDVAISGAEARQWANTKGHQLIQALSEPNLVKKYEQLDIMMSEDVNLDYVAKFVIGKYGKLMTPEQKNVYTNLFHRYAKSLYKKVNLAFDASTVDFRIDSVTEHEKFASVVCVVTPPKLSDEIKIEEIPVKFKLIRGYQNKIQAVDVEISEVSMVIEYRKRFYQMIKGEGEDISWFLEKFEDQVKANEESAAKRLQPLPS